MIVKKIFKDCDEIYFRKYGYNKNGILVGDIMTPDIRDLSEYLVDKYPKYFWYKHGPYIKCQQIFRKMLSGDFEIRNLILFRHEKRNFCKSRIHIFQAKRR